MDPSHRSPNRGTGQKSRQILLVPTPEDQGSSDDLPKVSLRVAGGIQKLHTPELHSRLGTSARKALGRLLCLNDGRLGIVACCFGLLGVPGEHPDEMQRKAAASRRTAESRPSPRFPGKKMR